MADSKFATITDDMKQLLDLMDSVNTQRVVKRSVDVFREFLGENCQFEDFPNPN